MKIKTIQLFLDEIQEEHDTLVSRNNRLEKLNQRLTDENQEYVSSIKKLRATQERMEQEISSIKNQMIHNIYA